MRLGPASVLLGVALALALTAVGQGGCAGRPKCARNSDCTAGYCKDGGCQIDCVDAALDCPKGYVCNAIAKCESPNTTSAGTGAGGASGTGTATTTATGTGGAAQSSVAGTP